MLKAHLLKQLSYKAWANQLTFESLLKLPSNELTKTRKTNFKNILHTLNHVYVIDDIFKAHLLGKSHSYTSRNTDTTPELTYLTKAQNQIDDWYVKYLQTLDNNALNDTVHFEFVGGGEGAMSRAEIIQHIVNHGTYHRGFVSDMMYQIPAKPTANDYTVFLRDAV